MPLNNKIQEYSRGEDFYWIGDVGEDISDAAWDLWAGLFANMTDDWADGFGTKQLLAPSTDIIKLSEANGQFLTKFLGSETVSITPGLYWVVQRVFKPNSGEHDLPAVRIRIKDSPTDDL